MLRSLVRDLENICRNAEGVEDVIIEVANRGTRRSIGFALNVFSATSLSKVRDAIRADPRVQMVF